MLYSQMEHDSRTPDNETRRMEMRVTDAMHSQHIASRTHAIKRGAQPSEPVTGEQAEYQWIVMNACGRAEHRANAVYKMVWQARSRGARAIWCGYRV